MSTTPSTFLKMLSTTPLMVVCVSTFLLFTPRGCWSSGRVSDKGDDLKRASSPTGHLCYICGRPATHSVRYTDGERWVCDTCPTPQQLPGGTASEGGGGGIFLALVGTGLHVLGIYFWGIQAMVIWNLAKKRKETEGEFIMAMSLLCAVVNVCMFIFLGGMPLSPR